MIRRDEADASWLIHQAAHAYIAGQIACHWIGSGAMVPAPRAELLVAAACHDAGWAAAEQQPRINGDGLPRTFTEMDLLDHFSIWRHSIEAVFAQNRYAGLLTSLHCTALYEQRLTLVDDPPDDRARIRVFLEKWHAWQRLLIAALTDHPRYGPVVNAPRLGENLRLLQVWDYLSLLLCMSTVREQTLEDVPLAGGQRGTLRVAASGEHGMALDPFPLDQPLALWIDARSLSGGPFASDAALRAVLVDVPYRPLVFEITRFDAE
jgi:hypothetical protein